MMRFAFDPDGTPICVAYDRNPPMDEDPTLVWSVAGDGSGRLLTEGMESFAGKQGTGDERLTVIPDAGRDVPCRVTDDGLVPLVAPELNPTAYELTGTGDRVVVLMSLNDYDGADVYALEPGREPRRRTAAGDAWLSGRARPEMQELIVNGPAGPIRTFVLSPVGASNWPMPTILHIHGGPTWEWPYAADATDQMLCGAGY